MNAVSNIRTAEAQDGDRAGNVRQSLPAGQILSGDWIIPGNAGVEVIEVANDRRIAQADAEDEHTGINRRGLVRVGAEERVLQFFGGPDHEVGAA